MHRPSLDQFTTLHQLNATAVGTALDLTGNRPTLREWRAFAVRLLHAAGLAALGAGLIFFVAANWQAWSPLGRLGLLQAGLLLAVGAAWWRAPPHALGQAALLIATLFIGALLALFGQTYQTGADLHELFFSWALLALPFAVAALSGAVWALWWGVLNVGLALLCGVLGVDHMFWRAINHWRLGRTALLMLPCAVNLIAAAAFLWLRGTRMAPAAPLWLVRTLATVGMAYGTVAAMMAVASAGLRVDDDTMATPVTPMFWVFAALSLAIAFETWRRRQDVFPLTLVAGSWIAISTAALIHARQFDDIGEFFVVALWLIVASTTSGMLLMRWMRAWRPSAALEAQP